MKFDPRLKSLALALLGVACMLAYFWLFANSRIAGFLRPRFSQEEIIAKAEQAFQQSPLAGFDLRRNVDVRVNDNLTRFVQRAALADSAMASLSLGYWEIAWRGNIPAENDQKQRANFRTRYDFSGKLVGVELDDPRKKNTSTTSQEQALTRANMFLAELAIDTSAFTLSEKKIVENDDGQLHQFSFTRSLAAAAALQEKVDVHVASDNITYFRSDLKVQEGKKSNTAQTQQVAEGNVKITMEDSALSESKAEKVGDIVVAVMLGLAWTIVIGFAVVLFFKRLRHDELEFKRAWWFGGLVMLAIFTLIAVENWSTDWLGVFLGGGFGGLFSGLGVVITYAVGDSVAREAWPEKLATTDLFFTGHLRVREIGEAILHAFFIAGVTALALGLVVMLANALHLNFLRFDDNRLWFLGEPINIITMLGKNVTTATYSATLILLFWAAYLKSRLKKNALAFVLLILAINFTSFYLDNFGPMYVSVFLMLPAAALWAYFTHKHDFLTIWLALLLFSFLLDLGLAGISPEGWGGTINATALVSALAFLGAGMLLVFQPKSAREFGGYVPAYVSRIAERERFLKELEIARNIQMRFLPHTAPNFPHLDIASICRPAMEVGGDYFDFVRDGEQRLTVVIGDVSGKGVSAAFYMTLAKGIIRALSRLKLSPKSLLSDMNTVFYENTPKEVFISLIYGLFDMENRTLTFARAGHNPLIVHKSVGGEAQLLHPRGLAIGMEHGKVFSATIEEQKVPIQAGDVFIFYTDGISEAMNKNGEEFGEERLRDAISGVSGVSAQEILEAITQDVMNFTGEAKQHDDFTMVVVRVKE